LIEQVKSRPSREGYPAAQVARMADLLHAVESQLAPDSGRVQNQVANAEHADRIRRPGAIKTGVAGSRHFPATSAAASAAACRTASDSSRPSRAIVHESGVFGPSGA